MAFIYDDELRSIEAKVSTGRVTKTAAAHQVRAANETEAARLEELAKDFLSSDRPLAAAYHAKAVEVRSGVEADLRKVAELEVSKPTRTSTVRNAATDAHLARLRAHQAATPAGFLEKGVDLRRPIGMPAPVGNVGTASTVSRGIGRGRSYVPNKTMDKMTHAEREAVRFRRAAYDAATPGEAATFRKMAEVWEEKARNGEA